MKCYLKKHTNISKKSWTKYKTASVDEAINEMYDYIEDLL